MNLFGFVPGTEEQVSILLDDNIRIERIVSFGNTSGWYDQEEKEWVMVVEGEAILTFEDGFDVHLKQGDSRLILAHQKHRVSMTSNPCIWLCVFYPELKQ